MSGKSSLPKGKPETAKAGTDEHLDPKVEPPSHVESDRLFFQQRLADKYFEITPYFDKQKWHVGEVYRVRVVNVYDLSHFWVITKYKELELLHQYINHFYKQNKDFYKIDQKSFKINMYCVCYTEGAFYRAVLASIDQQIHIKEIASLFLIDFGYICRVPISDIYVMTEALFSLPKFAVRACLSDVCPADGISWTSKAVSSFTAAIAGKVLIAQLAAVNPSHKVLFLTLSEVDETTSKTKLISADLIGKGEIVEATPENLNKDKNKRHKDKPAFLNPPFHELEECLVPDKVVTKTFLQTYLYHC